MRRHLALLLAVASLITASTTEAQQPRRIGFLSTNSERSMATRVAALREGLREHGYLEGKNIVIEYRYADGDSNRVPLLASELVKRNVDVIVTEGPTATRAAKQVTSVVPIVMGQDPDPVATGFVASLSRPGGNITGLTSVRNDLSAKRLEILKRAVPSLSVVAVAGSAVTPGTPDALRQTQLAADALGIRLHDFEMVGEKDIDRVFVAAAEVRAQAMLVLANPVTMTRRAQIAEAAARHGFAVMYYTREFVEDGGLMSYGVNTPDLFRRAASYVDRILKGAKPAELPVEQPTKFEFLINLRAAKAIGLTLPQALLYQADRIID